MISRDTNNAISSQESAGGALRSDLLGGQTIDLFGQEVPHANHSAAQENKKAKPMRDIYSQSGLTSSASVALQKSLESKLQARLPMGGLTMFIKGWKRKATPLGRQYCQLAVSVSRTKGTDSGLWATPNTMDGMGDRSLEAMNRQFQTTRKGRTAPANLREQVNPAMWPTPQARDWKGAQGRAYKGQAHDLPSLSAQTGSKGQLNPQFVCWLMGYSTAHLSSMLSAMQSYRKSRQNLSKQQCEESNGNDNTNA